MLTGSGASQSPRNSCFYLFCIQILESLRMPSMGLMWGRVCCFLGLPKASFPSIFLSLHWFGSRCLFLLHVRVETTRGQQAPWY